MKKVELFEPAMCCETGLCGVTVDPELLRISTFLKKLKNNGYVVKRFNLNSAPMEFVTNKVANQFINTHSVEELPIALVDGIIVLEGRYPTNQELLSYFEIAMEDLK
ncbi:MAG: arsenite efflux transporter metallochaperone ArsD [Anaeroplasma bactoclasticum]|nr:arsenite efflux transporter metallochaperone ArsD [Anaeroplasma bactoclasticum]